ASTGFGVRIARIKGVQGPGVEDAHFSVDQRLSEHFPQVRPAIISRLPVRVSRPTNQTPLLETLRPPPMILDEDYGPPLGGRQVVGIDPAVDERTTRIAVLVRAGFRSSLD